MATEVIKIVDPDNGSGTDYTSLAAAVAGEARDLVTADEQLTIKCRCTGGTADGAVTIDGFTTDATRYVKVWTDPSENYRHQGKPVSSGNVYRIYGTSNNGTLISCRTNHTKIIGLHLSMSYLTSRATHFALTTYLYGVNVLWDKCVFWDVTGRSAYRALTFGDYTYNTVSNCVFVNFGYNGYATIIGGAVGTNKHKVYNCTGYTAATNVGHLFVGVSSNERVVVINCVVAYVNNACFSTSYAYAAGSDTNVSYDTTAPGTTVAINKTALEDYFTDYANGDLSLKASGYTLFGINGTDLSSIFTDDILGNTRSAWDIGAFEYVSASTNYSLTSDNGSFTLTGQDATPKATRVVAGENGSFTFTGQEVTLEYLVSLTLSAAYGQFTLSGQDVNTLYSKLVSASLAEFTLTGQTALFKYSKSLDAGYGGYSFTGRSANLLKALKVAAERGSFDLTGQNATLVYTPVGGYTIVASQGTFSLAGQSAGLLRASRISSQYGSFSLSGQDSLFRVGKLVSAEPGVYQLSGQDLSFLRTHVLTSDAGLYILSGQDAGLVYVPHEELVVLAETGIFTLVFPNTLLKYSSEYAVTCSKVFKSPILAILYADSEVISEVLDKSKISKELVYNERDICW